MAITAVYEEPDVPNPFLLDGLTEEVLCQVLTQAEAVRREATLLDVPARGGLTAYFEKVRCLRESLLPQGWSIDNRRNYCTVVSPCEQHAIAVASGTFGTGAAAHTPRTARPMGPATAAIVGVNQMQLSLFDEPTRGPLDRYTWLLLSHVQDGTIFSELSLPDGMNDQNFVCTWRQRYVMTPIEPEPFGGRDESESEASSEIDVPVALLG